MRLAIFFVVSIAVVAANPLPGSPVSGKRSAQMKVAESSSVQFEETFRGGERACVIVRGDHKPVVNLGLSVFDANDKLVGKDEGAGDFVTVIWYPPRDAVYKIRIHNPGKEYNECYVSLK